MLRFFDKIFCSLLFLSVCYAVDLSELSNKRCSIKDSTCQIEFFQALAAKFAGTGIPELGIPVIEPFMLTDATIDVLGLKVTLVKGEAIGITTCIDTIFEINVETFQRISEFTCSKITIKGEYVAVVEVPSLNNVTCNAIKAHGNITMDIEDWYFNLRYPFEFVRQDDGNIYLKPMYDKTKYITEVQGNAKINANGFRIGNIDISDYVNKFFNDNWQIINTCFADSFYARSIQYLYDTFTILYNNIPVNTFISDDLSQYVTNDASTESQGRA